MKTDMDGSGLPKLMLGALRRLTVATLASTLSLHVDPRWARGDGYAIGPCPARCGPAADVALAYPLLAGWAPWLRCTVCGSTDAIEDTFIRILGSAERAARSLDWATEIPTPQASALSPVAEVERFFQRDRLISRSGKGVIADAIVLGADQRLSRRSRKPVLVLDFGVFSLGARVRIPMFIPFSMTDFMDRTLAALGAVREGLDPRSLVGRVARANVGAERGDFGDWRSRVGFLRESTRELVWVAEARRLIAACAAEGRRP